MEEEHRATTLRDDLGLELERLVSIDPPPELRVQLRARVARERVASRSRFGWQLAAAGAAALVLIVTLVIPQEEDDVLPPVAAPQNGLIVSSHTTKPIPPEPRPASARRGVAPAPRPADYPVLVMSPLEPISEIAIEPVAIQPLSAIAPLSGERQ